MHGRVSWLLLLLYFSSWAVALERVFLWPIPQHVVSGNVDLKLDPSFHIRGPDEVQDAIKRCMNTILADRWIPVQVPLDDDSLEQPPHFNTNNENKQHVFVNSKVNMLSTLEVSIHDINAELELGVDESYTLDISDKGSATLTAKTKWGALYGLETFSQLVQAYKTSAIEDYDDKEGQGCDTSVENLFIPETPIHIEDAPVYSHRGLMLDTARNYFPVKDILRTIDGMAYNKMNVFHWHITDSQSFPLRLESIPELAEHGAYVLGQRRLVYSKKDVERVIDYARARGVRVIPEIDMPAHTASWAESHKEITTCAGRFFLDPDNKGQYAAQPTTGQLNPILEETYHLVGKAISEVASLFPDAWYHGGGDEPFYKCWEQDAHVQHYMKTHNATGDDLLDKFLKREIEFIRESKKTPVLWEDPVTINNLELKDVVLQVWKKPVQQAVKKGYKVIASHAQFWYLDCGKGGWTGNDTSYDEQVPPEIPDSLAKELERYQVKDNYRPSNWGGSGNDWCSPFKTWQRIYSYDMTFNLTQEEAKLVLGGEVALWTEQTDPVGMDTRLWPRTAAAAEVLWSGRLVKRGIQAEALQPLWCGKNPRMCDSQYPEAFLQDRYTEGAIKHSTPGAIKVDDGDH
ncbi:beta-hexosaminidase 1 [Lichtheimia corymbifera JMRC:FSU:9682]|uniref:Beta-hexosaminidase n=1 Tax=Lichtheimia corymbifera JMRC:FSU:9682 TaxID=1263082 RepID=A0A068RJE8_9FUNG|nr:beta-hexosaminidase 1 [Lichtheimia corymbifera JMRC:FSU:9682]